MNIVQKLSENTKDFLENFFEILEEFERDIGNLEDSNSIGELFINQLTIHHNVGIKISENILDFTTNPIIEDFARVIVTTYNSEIDEMEEIKEDAIEVKNQKYDIKLYLMEFERIYKNMILKMKESQTGNNLNLNFITQILPLYEGGILLAKNALRFNICDKLKKLAEDIILSHNIKLKEIRQFQKSVQNQGYNRY